MFKGIRHIEKVKPTGLELKEKLVSIQRVTKVTKGGRTFSFSAIMVVGDQNGVIGIGLGKANDVVSAIAKGVEEAKKSLVRVKITNGTVPHEQYGKYGGGYVYIRPAAHGTGVIAGGAMRAIFESVGIHDILAKSKGSSNPHNVVKATLRALMHLRDAKTVAADRQVSLSKVFNG
jgi:small subunit ribosomal protein S5